MLFFSPVSAWNWRTALDKWCGRFWTISFILMSLVCLEDVDASRISSWHFPSSWCNMFAPCPNNKCMAVNFQILILSPPLSNTSPQGWGAFRHPQDINLTQWPPWRPYAILWRAYVVSGCRSRCGSQRGCASRFGKEGLAVGVTCVCSVAGCYIFAMYWGHVIRGCGRGHINNTIF